jgi:cell division protein FtsN
MHRGDTDAGGAADLQTDIMRFMAILALCLVAIFALVQSIPLVPEAPTQSPAVAAPPPTPESVEADSGSVARNVDPAPPTSEPDKAVRLTRPKWTTTFAPEQRAAVEATPVKQDASDKPASARDTTDDKGFTLRMTVSESRISFWDASAPNSYHEMETGTVPKPVIDALARAGVNTAEVGWGVTLPGKLREQLDSLMRSNSGGALVIGQDGDLRLEAS